MTAHTSPRPTPSRWRTVGPTSGTASTILAVAQVVLGIVWLTWPVWGSRTAAMRADAAALAPWLVAAQLSVAAALAVTLVRDARSVRPLTLVIAAVAAAVFTRTWLSPGINGIEPVLWIPMMVGAVLGAPAGVLTGTLACVVSSATIGTWATPLAGQFVVWQLWGLVGAAMTGMGTVATSLSGVVWCLVMGPVSGLLLNLIGWTAETPAPDQSFLAGLGPLVEAQRLWAWEQASSLAFDMSRAVTNAVLWAVLAPLLVGPLRRALAPDRRAAVRLRPVISEIGTDTLQRRGLTDVADAFPAIPDHADGHTDDRTEGHTDDRTEDHVGDGHE